MTNQDMKTFKEMFEKFQQSDFKDRINQQLLDEGYTLDAIKVTKGQADPKNVYERFIELLNHQLGNSIE